MIPDVTSKNLPLPSVERLPGYLRLLKEARNRGDEVISCTRIAEEFGQLSVQVRKDIAITGVVGRPKVGYQISELIAAIEHFLGWDLKTTACLVGAGSLGSAILKYEGFVEHGLNIIAAFDLDPEKTGQTIHRCPVLPFARIGEFRNRINIGIITVPAFAAQDAADKLIDIGVKAIWNYAPRKLVLPNSVICQDVKLSASFAVLSCRLLEKKRCKKNKK